MSPGYRLSRFVGTGVVDSRHYAGADVEMSPGMKCTDETMPAH